MDMEAVVSSSSEPISTDIARDILVSENKETSSLSSGAKTTNKKRRLEEDISTEQGSGEAIAGTSVGSSVTSSPLSQTSGENQGKESARHPHKKRHLHDELSGLDSSGGVADDDTGEHTISSIAAAARSIVTTAPPFSTTTPSCMAPLTSHTTSVQVSALDADPYAENSSGATAPDANLASLPLIETQIQKKDANTRPSKKARLDIESTATNPNPTSSSTLGSTEPLAAVISDANTTLQMDTLCKPSSFVVLPVELFSEILIYTGSSQHVLAVARTCKALCQTLLSPNNQFIWREARRASAFNLTAGPVYLPDPPKEFFGEAAYAAFVFDSGVCEACGKETSMMYASFALRARICKNLKCFNSAFTSFDLTQGSATDLITGVVPVLESNACLRNIPHESQLTFYPNSIPDHCCRASDWQNARAWIEGAPHDDAFDKKYGRAFARKIKWMEFAVSLQNWKFARQAHYYVIRYFNESQSKSFASKFGWEYADMINSTVYGLYHKQKNKVMERVKETDVQVMMDRIESQLLALSEKRSRHAAEVAYLKNRSDVEKYYNSIRSSKEYPIFPSLPTFCQLPVINLLQSASTTEGTTISQTLESNSLVRGLLSDQLKQWAETAKDDFAVSLGFSKKWKNASKNVLHPVERATVRFQCTQCGAKAKDRGNRADDGCLDFAAACRHVCNVGQGRPVKGKKARWDASKFVKDEKAIHALNKIIQALNYSEDKAGAHAMIALGLAVLCTSCDPPMILDSRSVVGHCHRHDAMELSLTLSVNTVTSYLGGYPFSFGLTEKLMGSERLTLKGKKAIESKNYGCRHCLRAKQVEPAAAAENEADEETGAGNSEPPKAVQVELSTTACRMHDRGFEGPKEKPPPLFNFNGMRSHLKAKHHIETIRDEDFLCYDAIDL